MVVLSIGFGIVTASVLALAAVGLTLQFGVTNYVNFAYGEFLTVGAYFAWTLSSWAHLNFWLGLVVAALLCAAFAFAVNRTILEPFVRRGSPLLFMLIVTLGLSLVFSNSVQAIWGPNYEKFNLAQQSPMHIAGMLFTANELVIIGIGVVAMVALHFLLTRTKMGKAMRAMSDNAELAGICGIDTRRVTDWTWILSGFLAGVAGVTLAMNVVSFDPATGGGFLFIIFAAVILGGIGKPYGAMLGALLIGLCMEVSTVFIDSAYKVDVAFAILILALLIRPEGIFRVAGKH